MINCPHRRVWAAVLCTVAILCSPFVRAESIDYDDPPQGVFLDDWMRIDLEGMGRVGYAHNEVARDGDHITSTTLLTISLARAGKNVGISVLQSSTESLDGQPLAFSHQMDMSAVKMNTRGEIKDGKVHVTATQYGRSMTNTYDFPQGALMSWGALKFQRKKGFKPGTTYTIKTFDPATAVNDALNLKVTIVGPEKIEIDDKSIDAILTKQEIRLPQFPTGVESKAWIDQEGNVLKTNVSMAGMNMVMTRTSKTQALDQFDPPEFFMPTTIPIKQRINRQIVQKIDYVLRPKNTDAKLPPIPATAMQTSRILDDGSIKVSVARLNREKFRTAEPGDQTGLDEFLSANNMINSDDPAVKKMAAEAKGSAKTPYEIGDTLRRYVTQNITEKNLNVGFATASEVCRNREGDCSEHAVLLAALGRASGLPSRVVTGLVYVPVFGGRDDIFGFHMWTQFRIGGVWVDFDAALDQTDCDPTHIAFNVDSLEHGSLGQVAFPLINVIGNLDMTIEKIEPETAVSTDTDDVEG